MYNICAVRSLSAVHKSQMLLLSAGPGAVNMLEQGDAKPNNNKQVFSVTNSSHFGTNNKSGAGGGSGEGGGGGGGSSGLSTAGGLKLQALFLCIFSLGEGVGFFLSQRKGRCCFFFSAIRWTRECLSVSPAFSLWSTVLAG